MTQLQKLMKNKKAIGSTAIVIIVLFVAAAIIGTLVGVGVKYGWFDQAEIPAAETGWTTDLKGTVQNVWDDYAGYAGATVRIYDDAGILKQTVITDVNGIFQTSTGTFVSFETYTFVIGSKTNGTALPQRFTQAMLGMDVAAVPAVIPLADPFLYKPTADESSVTIDWLSPGIITDWNYTALGVTFYGDIRISVITDGQGLRDAYDYTNSEYDYLVLTIYIDDANTTDQAGRIGRAGTPYDGIGTGSGWQTLTIAMSEIHYELDADGKITNTGKVLIPFSFDLTPVSWTGVTANEDAFYLFAYVTIGSSQEYWNDYGSADSTAVFNKYAKLSLTV